MLNKKPEGRGKLTEDLENHLKKLFRWPDEFVFHEQTISELYFSRLVDLFSIYIDDVLFSIFNKDPRTLKSNEKISYEEVVSSGSFEVLLTKIAEKKIREISYKNLLERLQYFKDNFGISFTIEDTHQNDLVLLAEIRNIFVHNDGFINQLFIYKTGCWEEKIGERVMLNYDNITKAMFCFTKAVRIIDSAITDKFGAEISYKNQDDFDQQINKLYQRRLNFSSAFLAHIKKANHGAPL